MNEKECFEGKKLKRCEKCTYGICDECSDEMRKGLYIFKNICYNKENKNKKEGNKK